MKNFKVSLLAGLLLICFWDIASLLLNQPFLPSPINSFLSLKTLVLEDKLLYHLLISFYRIVFSAILSLIFALPLGILMGLNRKIDAFILPLVSILYPLPKIVFLPIFIVLLGLGNAPKILIISLIVFFQILVVIRDSTIKIPSEYLTSFQTMSRKQALLIRHIILPSILGDLITSLRISVGSAIAVLFFAETFVSYDGLGYLILNEMEKRSYDSMYGAIIAMSLLGLLLYLFLEKLEKYYTKWK